MSTQTKPKSHVPAGRRVAKSRPVPPARKPRISAKNLAALRLLDSLMNCSEEEAQDQQKTFEFLKKALDEDRPGYRRLFPESTTEAKTR